MPTIKVYKMDGTEAGTMKLNDKVFGVEYNEPLIHQAVVTRLANERQGTKSTLTRTEVRGGGRKPWRQKGTGRARQGTIRAPQWRGGGTVFGPHTRSYELKVNRKEVKLAMRSALSAKLADNELVVVKGFEFDEPSTKKAMALIKALELEGKRITVVIGNEVIEAYLSFRNIPEVNILPVGDINTYELIDNKMLVIAEPCLKYIEEVLA